MNYTKDFETAVKEAVQITQETKREYRVFYDSSMDKFGYEETHPYPYTELNYLLTTHYFSEALEQDETDWVLENL